MKLIHDRVQWRSSVLACWTFGFRYQRVGAPGSWV